MPRPPTPPTPPICCSWRSSRAVSATLLSRSSSPGWRTDTSFLPCNLATTLGEVATEGGCVTGVDPATFECCCSPDCSCPGGAADTVPEGGLPTPRPLQFPAELPTEAAGDRGGRWGSTPASRARAAPCTGVVEEGGVREGLAEGKGLSSFLVRSSCFSGASNPCAAPSSPPTPSSPSKVRGRFTGRRPEPPPIPPRMAALLGRVTGRRQKLRLRSRTRLPRPRPEDTLEAGEATLEVEAERERDMSTASIPPWNCRGEGESSGERAD